MKNNRLLKLDEVAKRLGISPLEARILVIKKGAMHYTKVGKLSLRVKESDLEAYMSGLKPKEAKPTPLTSPSEGERDATDTQPDAKEPYSGSQLLTEAKGRTGPPGAPEEEKNVFT